MHNNHYTVLEEAVAGPKSRKKEMVQESMPDTRRGGFGGFRSVRFSLRRAGWSRPQPHVARKTGGGSGVA